MIEEHNGRMSAGNSSTATGRLESETNISRLVDKLFAEAIRLGASDIHIEPLEQITRIRFRIDGILHMICTVAAASHRQLVSKLKIMSDMDIAETRKPQDGRLAMETMGHKIDLRISTLPTVEGEKLAIRILDREQQFLALDKLDMSEKNSRLYHRLYASADGMLLITGPTGSGKSTTLYATLGQLNHSTKNIITIEDPVEYKLEGINQVAVNKKAGLTFAAGLRAFVRQDPNIIMVGEIRDSETASVAVQSALTGHFVLSTLHTNSAIGVVSRLLDMGVEPYLLTAALRGAVAQRLVRRICPHCKQLRQATAAELAYLGLSTDVEQEVYYGTGCDECHHTGYKGRLAVQEVVPFTETMGSMLLNGATEKELVCYARAEQGAQSLYEDGRAKVLRGDTTVAELLQEGILRD